MNIGDTFNHKFINNLSCEIISFTSKGVKVKQTEGKKTKQVCYYLVDFENSDRGLWKEKNK